MLLLNHRKFCRRPGGKKGFWGRVGVGTKDEHSAKIISELVSTTEEQDGLVRGPRELLQRVGDGEIFAA